MQLTKRVHEPYEYQRSRSFIDRGQRSLRFTFSNFFSLETARSLKPNFIWSLHGMGELKFVQMVQVTWPIWPQCPYMVNTLKNISSLEPNSRCPWKLVCNIGYSSTIKFIQMTTLGWPWPISGEGQIWSLMLLYEKNIMEFSETIVVCDIKVGRVIQLNEYMNLYEYQRPRSFIDLHPRSLRFSIFKLLLLRNC